MMRWLADKPRLLAVLLGAFCVLGFAPSTAISPSRQRRFLPWPACSCSGGGKLRSRPPGAVSPGAPAAFLAGVSWVYVVSLAAFSGMAAPLAAAATVLFCLYLALFPALAGALFTRWQSGSGKDVALFAASGALTEWLRGTLLTGFLGSPSVTRKHLQSPGRLCARARRVWPGPAGRPRRRIVGMVAASLLAPPPQLAVAGLLLGGGLLLRGMPWTTPLGEPIKVSLLQETSPGPEMESGTAVGFGQSLSRSCATSSGNTHCPAGNRDPVSSTRFRAMSCAT